jgi:hypothetical protein
VKGARSKRARPGASAGVGARGGLGTAKAARLAGKSDTTELSDAADMLQLLGKS